MTKNNKTMRLLEALKRAEEMADGGMIGTANIIAAILEDEHAVGSMILASIVQQRVGKPGPIGDHRITAKEYIKEMNQLVFEGPTAPPSKSFQKMMKRAKGNSND